jgi:hypothetical protein
VKVRGLYIVDEQGEVVPCADVLEWGRWFEGADRQVGDWEEGGVRVSTVFLGIDHDLVGHGPPVLWETRMFGGRWHGEQVRYRSRAAALAGHEAICRRVRSGER